MVHLRGTELIPPRLYIFSTYTVNKFKLASLLRKMPTGPNFSFQAFAPLLGLFIRWISLLVLVKHRWVSKKQRKTGSSGWFLQEFVCGALWGKIGVAWWRHSATAQLARLLHKSMEFGVGNLSEWSPGYIPNILIMNKDPHKPRNIGPIGPGEKG